MGEKQYNQTVKEMIVGLEYLYNYTDKSKLYRAWEKYYTEMGLSYTKKLTKIRQRVLKGKMPNAK